MIISQQLLQKIVSSKKISIPQSAIFQLPEKILQFGTGVLLRGLPEFFIDNANKKGIFNGRIVVVKSTNSGDTNTFSQQDNLYTICVKGLENGNKVEDFFLNASISRVLSAQDEWAAILACAANENMQVIISNTTEVGLVLKEDDSVLAKPPSSFPGKLLAFLHQRFLDFAASKEHGLVIIPTELIPDNGKKLQDILNKLASLNKLDNVFIEWMNTANYFCSSLVDRIVPGKLKPDEKKVIENQLGYEDDLMIMTEPYRLWAIEASNKKVNEILSFSTIDEGVIIAPDITVYRELKLRLLNGTHTLSCGLAVIAGFSTVKDAMQNATFRKFVNNVMIDEITNAITSEHLNHQQAVEFSEKVIDRFANPFIEHFWLNITLQYSSKMLMRNVPILQKHYEKKHSAPSLIALGFSGYILFMKPLRMENDKIYGGTEKAPYVINDDKANHIAKHWQEKNIGDVVRNILADKFLWGTDLTQLPGFAEAVTENCFSILQDGIEKAIENCLGK